jgi:hypothetical protein
MCLFTVVTVVSAGFTILALSRHVPFIPPQEPLIPVSSLIGCEPIQVDFRTPLVDSGHRVTVWCLPSGVSWAIKTHLVAAQLSRRWVITSFRSSMASFRCWRVYSWISRSRSWIVPNGEEERSKSQGRRNSLPSIRLPAVKPVVLLVDSQYARRGMPPVWN